MPFKEEEEGGGRERLFPTYIRSVLGLLTRLFLQFLSRVPFQGTDRQVRWAEQPAGQNHPRRERRNIESPEPSAR